jgi:hypothetical protein
MQAEDNFGARMGVVKIAAISAAGALCGLEI